MKAHRLLSILMLLQAHGRLTAGAIARSLEVSERTVLRDIDQLSAAGVPLWGERGHQGGFQLQPGWTTQLTGLPGPATALGLGEAAASARLKLMASVPAPWRDQAALVAERLHIDPLDWYRASDTPAFLRDAAQAVWSGKRLRVDYMSWRGLSRRELEPLGLVLKAGAWYLAARESRQPAVRTYRLASVRGLAVLGSGFRRPRGFDLARYWQESSARFEAGLRPLQARVLVSPRALGWLEHARHRFAEVPVAPQDRAPDGWRCVLWALESVEHGARQILGHGAEVEVVEPAALRAEVARQAEAIRARHATPLDGLSAPR